MFAKVREFYRFLKYNTVPERMEMKARKVVVFGANKAFEFFKDKQFRKLIRFDEKDEEEQNRVFNELTVTNIVYLMLLLEQLIQETDDEDQKNYFRALREAAPEYFKNWIRKIGIPEKFCSVWDKLVAMRYEEYIESMREIRGEFLSNGDPELNELATEKIVMIFQTVVLGLYDHLMRGKIKKGDPIYKNLQPYLLVVNKGYLKRI